MPSPKVTAYAAAIIAAATWWLWGSGVFAWRDMLVLEHPTMVVGLDLPARNAPQDWVLGVAGQVLPATWVLRAYVLTGAILGAVGAIRLATGPLGQCATLTLTLLNPFVLERLLQGQWALAVAAWLAPAVWAFRHHTPHGACPGVPRVADPQWGDLAGHHRPCRAAPLAGPVWLPGVMVTLADPLPPGDE